MFLYLRNEPSFCEAVQVGPAVSQDAVAPPIMFNSSILTSDTPATAVGQTSQAVKALQKEVKAVHRSPRRYAKTLSEQRSLPGCLVRALRCIVGL